MTSSYKRVEIDDDYEHPNKNIEYILENVLFEFQPSNDDEDLTATSEFENLRDLFNSFLSNACCCPQNVLDICCTIGTSNQNQKTFTPNSTSYCGHGGTYKSFNQKEASHENEKHIELILNTDPPLSGDLIYECTEMCTCDPSKCGNRLVQWGPRKNLEIIESTQFRSKGLITTAPIASGAFICEYAGELLTKSEARHRILCNARNSQMNYILCLKERCTIESENSFEQRTIIDPSRKGNIGRYLNHSCNPNCELFSVRVDCPIPKVGIFAKRNISGGEELCFHYGGGTRNLNLDKRNERQADEPSNTADSVNATLCLCGSTECEVVLPSLQF